MIYTLEYSKQGKPDVVEVKSNVVPLATPKHIEYLAHQMKCIVRDAGGLSVEDYYDGDDAA